MFVVFFYLSVFIASIVLTAKYLIRNKHIEVLLGLFLASIICDSLGQFLISISGSTDQAIWATKLMYIGTCYTPMFLALIMGRLCEIRIPKPVIALAVSCSSVIYAFALTIGYKDWYYKSCRLEMRNGYSYLTKEYGPVHIAFYLFITAEALFMIYIAVRAFLHRNKLPFKTVLSICAPSAGVFVAYVISRLTRSTIEWREVAYLFTVIVFTNVFEHIHMYDMTANIATSVNRMREYGFIVFDNKRKFINANDLVRSYFPEINDWKTEKEVTNKDGLFYKEVMSWYNAWCCGEQSAKILKVNDIYFELTVRDIVYGKKKKKIGDLVEIIDRTAEHNYTAKVESFNAELKAEVEAQTYHINQIKDKMVIGMAAMVDSRDNSTGGHIRRTSEVVSMFSAKLLENAARLGIDDEFVDMVIRAAPMHDLGKIAVDDAILKKRGKFTPEDYAQMKKHSAEGAKIVREILHGVEDERFVRIAENVAHYHHEKWNGAGYPEGLSGTEIPIEARIMALADVFDALVSKRCYKEAFSYEKAFGIISADLGTHFDPVLGKLFIECRPQLEALYDALDKDGD